MHRYIQLNAAIFRDPEFRADSSEFLSCSSQLPDPSFQHLLPQMAEARQRSRSPVPLRWSMAISSAAGGNHVRQLINVFEKIRYIEFRQISQILTDDLTEKQNVIQALECECSSWLAARRRFKDVHQVNWHWQFMKNWRETASEASSTWQERGAKLFDSFELELYAEPWPRFVEFKNAQESVLLIKELQTCMPAKFSMLMKVEENISYI